MPTTFNLSTAYRNEWELIDGVEDAVLIPMDSEGVDLDLHEDCKVVEGPVTHPELLSYAGGMRLRTAQLTVWKINHDATDPLTGHRLRRASGDWELHHVVAYPFSEFVCLASRIGAQGDVHAL